MFISHLAFFISVISLLLFFIRWVEHQFYERLLLLFIGLNVLETSVWLYCNFYSLQQNLWSDSINILMGNFSLILPFFYCLFHRKKNSLSTLAFAHWRNDCNGKSVMWHSPLAFQ
jgi:hypothetical protein